MERTLRSSAAAVIAAIACITVLCSRNAGAQSEELTEPQGRAGAFSALLFTYSPSVSWAGQGGSSMELDDAWGAGFGFGYHFSDRFQLNGVVSWSDRDFTATIVNSDGSTRQYNNTLDSTSLLVNGTYYFLKGAVTPFVSGGVGVTNIDTNIPSGVATTECWWDPWYGYVCNINIPTKTETFLSYTAGLGVSADIGRRYGLQLSYNKTWLDVSRASSPPDFDVWKLDLIFRIP